MEADTGSSLPRWTDHSAIILSVGAGVLVVLRFTSVAHADLTTASAILAEQGTGSVLFGTMIWILPVLPLVILGGFVVPAFFELPFSAGVKTPLVVASLVCLLGSLLLLPWPLAIVSLMMPFFVGLAVVARMLVKAGQGHPEIARVLRPAGRFVHWYAVVLQVGFLAYFVVLVGLSDRPWFPSEQISTSVGPAFTGYVLGEDGTDIVVMDGKTRFVARLPKSNLMGRFYCSGSTNSRQLARLAEAPSLVGLLASWGKPNYPPCTENDDWWKASR